MNGTAEPFQIITLAVSQAAKDLRMGHVAIVTNAVLCDLDEAGLEITRKAKKPTHEAIIDFLAEYLWRCDYPNGGSMYKTYGSTPSHDQDQYRQDATVIVEAQQGGEA